MKFAIFISALALASQAIAADYTCRTVHPLENKGRIPNRTFTISARPDGKDFFHFEMTAIKGYTYEILDTEDGGLEDFDDSATSVFMGNGCDQMVQIAFPSEVIEPMARGRISKVRGLIVEAGGAGGPALENVSIACVLRRR